MRKRATPDLAPLLKRFGSIRAVLDAYWQDRLTPEEAVVVDQLLRQVGDGVVSRTVTHPR